MYIYNILTKSNILGVFLNASLKDDIANDIQNKWNHYAVQQTYCCDRKSRAACAQSFAPWEQATIEITRRDHSIIACSRHIHTFLFFAHIPFMVNHTINATPPERLQQYQEAEHLMFSQLVHNNCSKKHSILCLLHSNVCLPIAEQIHTRLVWSACKSLTTKQCLPNYVSHTQKYKHLPVVQVNHDYVSTFDALFRNYLYGFIRRCESSLYFSL